MDQNGEGNGEVYGAIVDMHRLRCGAGVKSNKNWVVRPILIHCGGTGTARKEL